MSKNFLRRTWSRYSKLGKRRKKKQVWRRPTGRDNKMRERRKGWPARVSVGYKQETKFRGQIENKSIVRVQNIKDLEKAGKNSIVIIGNIGIKKKREIVKEAKEKKIEIYQMNPDKFLKKTKKKPKKKIEVKDKKTMKKEAKEKKKEEKVNQVKSGENKK